MPHMSQNHEITKYYRISKRIELWKREVWHSGFKIQTGPRFRIRDSYTYWFKYLLLCYDWCVAPKIEEIPAMSTPFLVGKLNLWDSNFRALFWNSYFREAGIQDSNYVFQGLKNTY